MGALASVTSNAMSTVGAVTSNVGSNVASNIGAAVSGTRQALFAANKPWAVTFADGERRTYTRVQMQKKFGLADIQPGARVYHSTARKSHGHGTVEQATQN